jgi:predicted nucleic acid-binding Zn ribbon protein
MGFIEKIIRFFQDGFKNLTDKKKRQVILICTAVFAALLVLSVLLSFKKPEKNKRPDDQYSLNFQIPIPPDEIFLSDEPDFVPGVILERERRTAWTEQDALEYWQDPLKEGEEQWRENIETEIDKYLERVP